LVDHARGPRPLDDLKVVVRCLTELKDLRVDATVRAAAVARGNCGLFSKGSLRSLEIAEGV
jgi:hypothetical protein